MKEIDPGHTYELDWLDGRVEESHPEDGKALYENHLTFVKRENAFVLYNLRLAIFELEQRAAERHGRMERFEKLFKNGKPISANDIEDMSTCSKCLHIGCEGACRP